MDSRIKGIYSDLYQSPQTKVALAERYGVTTKTIENTVEKMDGDVVYDRSLGAYRFAGLLPKYIPHNRFFHLLKESVGNKIIKVDFEKLAEKIKDKEELNLPLIPTRIFSPLVQRIIMLEVAITSNCVVRFDLKKGEGFETKYVQPGQVFSSGFTYYLRGVYDERNEKNPGEARSFALNNIHHATLQPVEYVKNGRFRIEGLFTPYGEIKSDRFVLLELTGMATDYFKREGLMEGQYFDFVSEEVDGTVLVKMYYANLFEIEQLVTKWMPLIHVHDTKIAHTVYDAILQKAQTLSQKARR